MPKKENIIQLSEIDRMELQDIVRTGTHKARIIRRAQTLLWSDAGKTDSEIAELHGIRPLTVAKTRPRWVEERSLEDKPRPGASRSWMANKKRFWWRWRAVMRRMAMKAGRCNCWRTSWLSFKSLMSRFRTKPCGYGSKKDVKPWLKEQWCIPTVSSE